MRRERQSAALPGVSPLRTWVGRLWSGQGPQGVVLLYHSVRDASSDPQLLSVTPHRFAMHMAWLVGCPVLALFGPTDPRLNAPWADGHVVLRAATTRMRDLSPEPALEALSRLLAGRVPGAGTDRSGWGRFAAGVPSPA